MRAPSSIPHWTGRDSGFSSLQPQGLVSSGPFGGEKEARSMLEKSGCRNEREQGESSWRCSIRAKAGSRIVISMCSAPTRRTAFSPRIPSLRGQHLQEIVGKKGYPLGKEIMGNADGRKDQGGYLLVASPGAARTSRSRNIPSIPRL